MASPIKFPKSAASWPSAGRKAPAGAPAPAVPAVPSEPFAPSPAVAALRRSRASGDMLGVVWTHGAMHVAVLRRQIVSDRWEASAPVRTLAEFAAALDASILALRFTGTEIFFVLAHDEFVHQAENGPAFSEKAALAYLRGRVERLEQEREPMLWVCQRAAAVKKEGNYILHLLPVSFYIKLNELLLLRRLDLTRILPLHVPLQLALSSLTETRDMPLLVATEAGSSTAVLVGKTGNDILFARTILESWSHDAGRVAVEINRSLLYAKQQFGTSVDFLWLLGRGAEEAQTEVAAKCGKASDVVVEDIGPVDWLQACARLTPRHPINLVGRFLSRKRRGRFFRRVVVAASWLGLVWFGIDAWTDRQSWSAERARLTELRADEDNLRAERARLSQRNADVARHRALVHEVVEDRLPPVASKFLAYAATILPREASLTNLTVKWNESNGGWEFQLDGSIKADAETAASMVAAIRRQFETGPFRARIVDTVRAPTALVVGGQGTAQSLRLEGTLFAY